MDTHAKEDAPNEGLDEPTVAPVRFSTEAENEAKTDDSIHHHGQAYPPTVADPVAETKTTEPTLPAVANNVAGAVKDDSAADLSGFASVAVGGPPPPPPPPPMGAVPTPTDTPHKDEPTVPMESEDPNTPDGSHENDDDAEASPLDAEDRALREVDARPSDNSEWQPPKKRRRKPEPMKPFNDMLYELLAFRAREGHCRVPLDAKSALGRWVANLRTQKSNLRKGYHSLDLNPERLAVLDSVDFVWDLQQFDSDSRWKRQFEELCAFKAEHGHCEYTESVPSAI